jgi:hypothetical protein
MRRAQGAVRLLTFEEGSQVRVGQEGVDQMEHFEESTAGRLLTLAVIVPLAAGASVTWDDGRAGSIVIMGSIAIGTILATVGGGAAMERRVKYTIAAMLVFPPALLLYFPLIALASQLPAVRLVMGSAALVLAGFLLKGSFARAQPRAATPTRRVAPHLA